MQPNPELARVYEEHVASVWRYVRARVPDHGDAQDATSEVFVRAARGWSRYDPAKGAMGAWLVGIAHHVVADWWRTRATAAATTLDDGPLDVPAPPEPFDPDERVDAQAVRRHLHLLTDRERDALALRFGADLSSQEVGEILGISDAGARMLVYRAVGKLRGAMGGPG